MVLFSLALILIMIFRPQGLLGTLDFRPRRRAARKAVAAGAAEK